MKCGNEFLTEETGMAKTVDKADRCFNCNSPRVVKVSKPDADIVLYFCEKCHCYMGIEH